MSMAMLPQPQRWITRLHYWLTAKPSSHSARIGLGLSLLVALIYGLLSLQGALNPYVLQDDARQHVFWMQRFMDPALFPNDWMADYYQSVAPPGYTALYRLMANLGVHPFLWSKLLPTVLGLVTTGYCFGVCWEILPVPLAGFIASLLLNQNLWMQDSLTSGTARAFVFPIFLAFLYYLLRSSWIGTLAAIALLAGFYPPYILVAAGVLILRLWDWQHWPPRQHRDRQRTWLCLVGLALSFVLLLPQAIGDSPFDPVVTLAQAQQMPEFGPGGRTNFFNPDSPWDFWFNDGRSGLQLISAITSPLMFLGFLLPVLLRFKPRYPLAHRVNPQVWILPQLAVAGITLFLVAHALLFKFYLPSRYSQHSLRIALTIASGIALTLILDALLGWASQRRGWVQPLVVLAGCATVLLGQLFYPQLTMSNFPWTGYMVGQHPELYEFFAQQPKDIMIASLSDEADNLPSFTGRSVLVNREYAIPYHMGYYEPLRQRAIDLIRAQYSPDPAVLQGVIQTYGIDFWLVDPNTLSPNFIQASWLRQYQTAIAPFLATLPPGQPSALAQHLPRCTVLESQGFAVVDANCLLQTPPP